MEESNWTEPIEKIYDRFPYVKMELENVSLATVDYGSPFSFLHDRSF
jgi:hypothetical protein